MIERELKRSKLIKKYSAKRKDIKESIRKSTDYQEIMDLQLQLRKLPLNSNPIRHNPRCQQCGRIHAVYKKFGLCRICLRKHLLEGDVTGGRISSW